MICENIVIARSVNLLPFRIVANYFGFVLAVVEQLLKNKHI